MKINTLDLFYTTKGTNQKMKEEKGERKSEKEKNK